MLGYTALTGWVKSIDTLERKGIVQTPKRTDRFFGSIGTSSFDPMTTFIIGTITYHIQKEW